MLQAASVLSVLVLGLWLYCLLDVVLTDPSLVRNLPKLAWVVLVVLLPLVGSAVWLVGGRPQRATFAPGGTRPRPSRRAARGAHPAGRSRPSSPKGPDDDPAFLAQLDRRLREQGTGADDEADERDGGEADDAA